MVPISGKVEWKYTFPEHGALSLTLIGPVMMHKLSVTSWSISNQVPKLIHYILVNTGDQREIFCPSYSIHLMMMLLIVHHYHASSHINLFVYYTEIQ